MKEGRKRNRVMRRYTPRHASSTAITNLQTETAILCIIILCIALNSEGAALFLSTTPSGFLLGIYRLDKNIGGLALKAFQRSTTEY